MTARARARLLLAVAVAASALLAAGCSADVVGEPAPQPGAAATPAPTTALPTRPQRPPSGGCTVAATAGGSISSSGAGGRTQTTNGRTAFSCGSGASLIVIESIEASGVTFSTDGATVAVASGAEGVVGPYRITVTGVDGGTARFQVAPSG
jgi:hypothetical protein